MLTIRFTLLCFISLLSFDSAIAQSICREVFAEPALRTSFRTDSAPLPAYPKARSVNFEEGSATRAFVEFAEANLLMPQFARELGDRGFIQPNGGLCATTCAANLLAAMTASGGNLKAARERSPDVVHLLLDSYLSKTGDDARFGVDIPDLADVMIENIATLIDRFHPEPPLSQMNVSLSRSSDTFNVSELSRSLRSDDSISIVTVETQNPNSYMGGNVHAIVVLKVDLKARKIILSDPFEPNNVMVNDFVFIEGQPSIAFLLPALFKDQPVTPIEFKTFNRHLISQ